MFASLVIEQGREPLTWAGMPAMIQNWLLVAGIFSLVAMALYLLIYAVRALSGTKQQGRLTMGWLAASIVGGTILAVVARALPLVWTRLGWVLPGSSTPVNGPSTESLVGDLTPLQAMLWLGLAGFGLVAVMAPVIYGARLLRWRRIWALARLSMKEAVRSKILWAFSFLLLLFLFGSWFITSKPDQQVQTYVETAYTVMTALLILTAGLLASLAIPNDLRRQTIHTLVTKPVERFEIVLGRVLGNVLLMGAVLAVMTFFSLVYVWRGVDPDAKRESLRARVPVFGQLQVIGHRSVGREWGYRKYIGMLPQMEGDPRAIWTFYDIPSSLASKPGGEVRLEYGFDVFRTWKGHEGVPVNASFRFETCRWNPDNLGKYRKEYDREYTAALRQHPGSDVRAEVRNRLAEKYGYFEIPDAEVVDFHTVAKEVPASLFKDLKPAAGQPALTVTVRCQSSQQFLGVAQPDLYLLERDGSDNLSVAWNFYKGAAGIGLLVCLVVGVAVTCSTYLNGIVSFLLTFALLWAGLSAPFIHDLAMRKNAGGGPMEALVRLTNGDPISKPLDPGAAATAALAADKGFSYAMKGLLYVLPGIDHLSLTEYVARGFNISSEKLLVDSCLPLVGYLLLWFLIAFYLMKWREIAA